MNNWQTGTPRTAIGLAAATLSAVTLAVGVVLPARLGGGTAPPPMLAATPRAPTAVAIVPGHIHVVGVREPDVAWALGDPSRPCKPAT